MKCYEVRKCSKEEREACYVWNSFRDNPQDIENVKCWVLKGAYQEESGEQLKKCKQCAYFIALNRDAGVASEGDTEVAVITCEGAINTERTRALEKVWETLRQQNRVKIILDLSRVNNIYSCGLGAIIKIHKETLAAKGQLVVVVTDGYLTNLFAVTKLSRLLRIVKNNREARDVFDAVKKARARGAAQVGGGESCGRGGGDEGRDRDKGRRRTQGQNRDQGRSRMEGGAGRYKDARGGKAARVLGILEGPSSQQRDHVRRVLHKDKADRSALLDR